MGRVTKLGWQCSGRCKEDCWWGVGGQAKADVSIAEELRLHSNSRRDPSAQYSAPAQFAQLCNCEILLCEQFSHLHSCAIALSGRVMDARGATSSLLRRLSPSRPWLALGTCAVLECVRRECSHDKHVTYLSDKSFLKKVLSRFSS